MGERGSGATTDDASGLNVRAGSRAEAVGERVPLDASVERALARIRARSPKADPLRLLPDVHPDRLPRHIAIIMDGNGRWAAGRGLPRAAGHEAGGESVRRVIETAGLLGIEVVTLYSFSVENWKRSSDEIDALMALCLKYLASECEALVREGIRLKVVGRREGLPRQVLAALDHVVHVTSEGRAATLCLALNYGGRAEIVDAARRLAEDVASGRLTPDEVDESVVESRLYTAGLPDPDLLIRTAGELRVSNFLLWQISYAELHVSPVLWPDYGVPELLEAVRDFARRTRRFGAVPQA